MSLSKPEPIAVIGSSCRFPGGANNLSKLWQLLKDPVDLATDIPKERFDLTGFYHPDASHHGTTNVRQSYLLQENIREFDPTFFNISPNEADSMDPQHRLILETAYEALEASGHSIESLKGSDTAVFTGTMCVDYNDTWLRDMSTIPHHFATGVNRAVISNRISYFFDWHGPSMTIDTACSSSLVAVHEGVKSLRAGEAQVVLACGTQVILNPEIYVMESKLKMLSPTSRSRMWDADADGYARGEGVAAIVLKRLSDAIAHGDHIECIIRETGSNQDGHSQGITVPSTEAQASLIRKTYARAGLDPENNPNDRPQFFEAHGTGTKAGDPREAAAIHDVFGTKPDLSSPKSSDPLYVGSIKTVVGHLEGTAGLAGLLKASVMVQKGDVLPNLLFNRLNPDVAPYYHGLQIPTEKKTWPSLPAGVPRRVSVNSFGFGGTNAHAIIEQFSSSAESVERESARSALLATPYLFSAASEISLVAQLRAYSTFLEDCGSIDANDLSWTLRARRSELAIKASFPASDISQLKQNIDAKLIELERNPDSPVGVRSKAANGKRAILGIFTGQGAQWPAMGAGLIHTSQSVREKVLDLEDALATLPPADRPTWSLMKEMLADQGQSRVAEAAISQPLCTAVQVILVDLLRTAGIHFAAVVGHSSGEIAAAYAAGFINAHDAIRIAYYRGMCVDKVGSGSMMAVGTSFDDAVRLTRLRAFRGRIVVAAHNSPASVTMSGDSDAIAAAKDIFDEEKKFARLLKVDKAYHSHHMLSCSDTYVAALEACDIRVQEPLSDEGRCHWFSSVHASSEPVSASEGLKAIYWKQNMAQAVLFADAVKNAVASNDQIGLALEIGPHPALKGPATQNIAEVRPEPLPYFGTLSRGLDDIQAFSSTLGFCWSQLGSRSVDLNAYDKQFNQDAVKPKLSVGLPSYQWNHSRSYWCEPRRSRRIRTQDKPPHELLGVLAPESNPQDLRWSNVLKPSEIPWTEGHKLQNQTVFPAAGYVCMAVEASRIMAGENNSIEQVEVQDLAIPKAITFDGPDDAGVETSITLTSVARQPSSATAFFSCYASAVSGPGSEREMELIASGRVKVTLGEPRADALAMTPHDDYNMFPSDIDRFYSSLENLGYGYSGPFRALRDVHRRLNHAKGTINAYSYTESDLSQFMLHPCTLDVAFQLGIMAFSAPGDGRLWSLHVPTSIKRIRVNAGACASLPSSGASVPAQAAVSTSGGSFSAYIDLASADGQSALVHIEDLVIKPFAPATEANDNVVFTHTAFDVAVPDASTIVGDARPDEDEIAAASACERIAYHYHRKWARELTDAEWADGPSHQLLLKNWVDHTIAETSAGRHPSLRKEWAEDTPEMIQELTEKYSDRIDVRLLRAVGDNMVNSIREHSTILEHMRVDGMLDEYYETGPALVTYNSFLATIMKQITHRYPQANIIEIGAGTGGATKYVIEAIGSTMSSYTYTDISPAFFENAAEALSAHKDKMIFRTLDIESSPSSQGYKPHSYDVAVAFNVLHATRSLQETLTNTRQLLKPGGHLVLLEFTNNDPIRFGTTMAGLSGWWLGADDGRVMAPTVSTREWHAVLRKSGFSGVDTVTPELDRVTWPISILVGQAVDDRVGFLRRPLAPSSSHRSLPSIRIESLVILGTGSMTSSIIADEISELLDPFCDQITVLDGLPTASEASSLKPLSTFINLVDLDTPIFKNVTASRMEALQRMLELAKHVLWVTQGAVLEQPYHLASMWFSRTVRRELTHVSLNHIDVSDAKRPDTAKCLAEHLLRLFALDEWEANTADAEDAGPLLWSKEPEVFMVNGNLKIPRLVPNPDQNDRLNATRRTVTKTLATSSLDQSVALVHQRGKPALVQTPQAAVKNSSGRHGQLLDIEYSSFLALRILPGTFLFLGGSTDRAAQRQTLTLSTTSSRKVEPLASFEIPKPSDGLSNDLVGTVIAAGCQFIARSIIEDLPAGARLLVHCSSEDSALLSALSDRAVTKGVHLTLTCDEASVDLGRSSDVAFVRFSAQSPSHELIKAIYFAQPTHFLDMSPLDGRSLASEDLVAQIKAILPTHCITITSTAFAQNQSVSSLSLDASLLSRQLEAAALSAIERRLVKSPPGTVLSLQDLQNSAASARAVTVVDWSLSGPVAAFVQPCTGAGLFRGDRTYLLTGLSGQIGQSLCEFMVVNGAKYVVLTSRSPKINAKWIESFKNFGATILVLPMDVTNKESVETAVQTIRASCPPIAGVAHGANILFDQLFSGMTFADIQRIISPKVDGANVLDAVFNKNDLDWFLLFSSVSGTIGNLGQSIYSAANGYLNGIARQRRRRGLAASVFDIGRVVGLGYIENVDQHTLDQLLSLGLDALSETDLRVAFAEAIMLGYPRPEDQTELPNAVMTAGIRRFRDDEDVRGPWFSNPFFSHLVTSSSVAGQASKGGLGGDDGKSSLRVGQRIAEATSLDEVASIIQECFISKLRIILQIFEDEIDPSIPAVELGIDSLVAVEIRSWFLKEMKVDVPVLKIVGGMTIIELCDTAQEGLPKELLAKVGAPNTGVAKTTPAPQLPPLVHTTTATTASSYSASTASNSEPASSSRATTPEGRSASPKREEVDSKVPEPQRTFTKEVPMSMQQSRYWFLSQLLRDQKTSNVACYYHIEGNLRAADFERATQVVLARHESLRTCFIRDEADAAQANQCVLSEPLVRLKRGQAKSTDEVVQRFQELREQVFDLASGELLKLILLTLTPTSHYLLVHHHHIIADGISVRILLAELEKAYLGRPLPPVSLQYPDFAVAQQKDLSGGKMDKDLQYWRSVFPSDSSMAVLPLLPMARTNTRNAMKEFDTHEVQRTLDIETATRIRAVAKKQLSTPFHFYLAVFQAMLFRLTDAEEITVGMADAARNTTDAMGSVGFFLNLLPLKFRRELQQSFKDSLTNARKTAHAALKTSQLPFDVLLTELGVGRSASHSPLFQCFVDYRQGNAVSQKWANCRFEMQDWHLGKTAYDITVDVTDTPTHAVVMMRTQKQLYDETAATLLLDTYINLLGSFSSGPSASLESPDLYSPAMLSQSRGLGRGPCLESDWPETLPHRIDAVIQGSLDRIALMDGKVELTYADMSARIDALASELMAAHTRPGDRVLVLQEASADWICSMLAIMRVGAVYVPMDTRNPVARLAAIARDAEPTAVLADKSTIGLLPQLETEAAAVDVSTINSQSGLTPRVCNIAQAKAPAAIFYTSGSTGTPKGIIVTHYGLRNEIEGYTKTWKLGAERVLQQSAFTFDFASDQIYTGLVNGGMVYVVPSAIRGNPVELAKLIKQHGITYTRATPSEYSVWLTYGREHLANAEAWRHAFAGGEVLTPALATQFRSLNHQVQLYNSYGPAETSISSCKGEVDYRHLSIDSQDRIPCGYSLPNYNTYIVDEKLRLQPPGVPGEVCVGGAGVSQGYLNNPQLTGEHFISDPFATPEDIKQGWTRMYRTGDIGHLMPDGALVFHRRVDGDTRVKIRGLRVDCADIESNMVAASDGALREAVVTLRQGDPDFLVAHVVFEQRNAPADPEAFLESLLRNLPVPQYMIPVVAIPMNDLPLTNHGKVDRKAIGALPLPKASKQRSTEVVELTPTMVSLRELWQEVVGHKLRDLGLEIDASTSFFTIGGNSLLVIRLQHSIEQRFGAAFQLTRLLNCNTLAEMAQAIDNAAKSSPVDWEVETILPVIPTFLDNVSTASQKNESKTVLLTGGTGFLSRYLLPLLVARPDVSKIHCVALRDGNDGQPRDLITSEKVIWHRGNLNQPLLGLEQPGFQDLAAQADIIYHLGGVRSIWDSYAVLRSSNVHPTRELVKLAAPRKIPIHFISTIGASSDPASAAKTTATCPDGFDGYVTSKWASERILTRAAEELGVPSSIYRFLPRREAGPASQHLTSELARFAKILALKPDPSGWEGRMDMLPVSEVAQLLCRAVDTENEKSLTPRFEHIQCDAGVSGQEIVACTAGDGNYESIPLLKWFGRIKALGFDYFIGSHEATVSGKEGGVLGTSR